MMVEQLFTTTTLVATATEVLLGAGYRRVDRSRIGEWPAPEGRVFEDPYSVAAVVGYETWTDLAATWLDAQAALADLLSRHFHREDAKAWDGYLVLMTPSVLPRESRLDALALRSNTTHTRKLLITGEDVQTLDDVERGLLPLLPLHGDVVAQQPVSVLELLPDLLERRGVRRDAVEAVIRAFAEQQPPAERLNELLETEMPE